MPRIRTIKPEFPQSETIGSLSRDSRLLFIQLWTIVDDSGRARAASRMLASLLYPYDDDAPSLIDGWLAELEEAECIQRYEICGSRYLEVVNWLKHQKIDKPSQSKIPPFDENSRIVANSREASATDLGPVSSIRKRTKVIRAVAEATRPEKHEDFEKFWQSYPRRLGANPKAPAAKVFDTFIRSGVPASEIIAGAVRCSLVDADKIGTQFIPQAVKWLRDRRWEDYSPEMEVSNGRQQNAWDAARDSILTDVARWSGDPERTIEDGQLRLGPGNGNAEILPKR